MHRVMFSIGSFQIYSYGVFIAVAFLICIYLIKKECDRIGVSFDKFFDCLIWIFIAGIVGGRALYVLIHMGEYSGHPLEAFMVREGGMAFHGSLISGAIVGIIVCRKMGISFRGGADILAPYIALGHSIGRIGCFFNGCCYGKPAAVPFGVVFPGELTPRIPVQIYSSLFLLSVFVFLLFRRDKTTFKGQLFLEYLLCFSLGRFFLDFFRGDNPAVFSVLTLGQLISIGIFLLSVALIAIGKKKHG